MSGNQKRAHDRHTLSLFMEVFDEKDYSVPLFKCRTNNIGIGGLMINNQEFVPGKDSNVNVVLKATCKSGLKEFPVEARIVWVTSEAVGMQFYSLNEEDRKNFKRFLFESKVAVHSGERRRLRDATDSVATVA